MNIHESRAKLSDLEESKGNFTQQWSKFEPSEKHWISHGMWEHETNSDLCFGAKQISVLTRVSSHSSMEKKNMTNNN